jgi:hypothetical protein
MLIKVVIVLLLLMSLSSHFPAALRKFVIVRDIPNIGDSNAEALTSISQASCKALAKTGHGEVQWVHTYITQDK